MDCVYDKDYQIVDEDKLGYFRLDKYCNLFIYSGH